MRSQRNGKSRAEETPPPVRVSDPKPGPELVGRYAPRQARCPYCGALDAEDKTPGGERTASTVLYFKCRNDGVYKNGQYVGACRKTFRVPPGNVVRI